MITYTCEHCGAEDLVLVANPPAQTYHPHEVRAKREQENELIREAVIEFLLWRGWMRMELKGQRSGAVPTLGRIQRLTKAVEAAIGGELEEHT